MERGCGDAGLAHDLRARNDLEATARRETASSQREGVARGGSSSVVTAAATHLGWCRIAQS